MNKFFFGFESLAVAKFYVAAIAIGALIVVFQWSTSGPEYEYDAIAYYTEIVHVFEGRDYPEAYAAASERVYERFPEQEEWLARSSSIRRYVTDNPEDASELVKMFNKRIFYIYGSGSLMKIFGQKPALMFLLPTIASVFTTAALYFLFRLKFTSRASLIMAVVGTSTSTMIWLSATTLTDGMYVVAAWLSIGMFLRLNQVLTGRLISLFIALAIVTLLIRETATLLWLSLAVASAVQFRAKATYLAIGVLLGSGVYLVVLPHVVGGLSFTEYWEAVFYHFKVLALPPIAENREAFEMSPRFYFDSLIVGTKSFGWWMLNRDPLFVAVGIIGVIGMAVTGLTVKSRIREYRSDGFLMMSAALVLGHAAFFFIWPNYEHRYYLVTIPALFTLGATGLMVVKPQYRRLIISQNES